jgi:hypothetical protein
LDVVDRVNEVPISCEESDRLDLAVERIIYQVYRNGDVHFSLDLPLDLLLAAAPTSLSSVFEVSFIDYDSLLRPCLVDGFIQTLVSGPSFRIFRRHKADLIELRLCYGLKESNQDQEIARVIQWQEVVVILIELVHAYLKVGTVDDENIFEDKRRSCRPGTVRSVSAHIL